MQNLENPLENYIKRVVEASQLNEFYVEQIINTQIALMMQDLYVDKKAETIFGEISLTTGEPEYKTTENIENLVKADFNSIVSLVLSEVYNNG